MQITLSNTEKFAQIKTSVERSQLIKKEVSLSTIDLIDSTTLKYQGRLLQLSKTALKDLFKLLNLNSKLLENLNYSLGTDVKNSIVKAVKNAVFENKKKEVFLCLNPSSYEIERILVTDKKGGLQLSSSQYLDILDNMLNDNPNFNIDFYGVDSQNIRVNLLDSKSQFEIKNMKDEIFSPGLSFNSSYSVGTELNLFNKRLVCSNGMVCKDNLHSVTLKRDFSETDWTLFYEKVGELKRKNFINPAFAKKVKEANETACSVAEMNAAVKSLQFKSNIGLDANLWIPYSEVYQKYENVGVTLANLNQFQLATAKTGNTVWSVVNAMTDFASKQYNYEITNTARNDIQIQAGKLFSKDYDMNNVVRVSPY